MQTVLAVALVAAEQRVLAGVGQSGDQILVREALLTGGPVEEQRHHPGGRGIGVDALPTG
jgi:hypothetical protein